MTFAEDTAPIRIHSGPPVLACPPSLAIGVLSRAGQSTSPPRHATTAATTPTARHPWHQARIKRTTRKNDGALEVRQTVHHSICAGQQGYVSNMEVVTRRRRAARVVYTPALQPYWEARDEAVAASGLLSRKSTSVLEALEQALTCDDRLTPP